MKRAGRLGDTLSHLARRLRVRFFWQLVLAFALVIALVGGGVFLAGRSALRQLEMVTGGEPSTTTVLWADRLADYYAAHGSWDGVEAQIAGYPCGLGWAPWEEGWQLDYALAAPDGTVLSSSRAEQVGQRLRYPERALAVPVVDDGQRVGLLFMPLFDFAMPPPSLAAILVQRFLWAVLAIVGFGLVVGLLLSRGISRPLVHLTQAARAVAAGDLKVRAPVPYQGEARDLAVAFNAMTEELARADELRRNLTADVAHELRTPLSVVRGKLEGVLDGVYPATPEHLQPVVEEVLLLTQLVEDLRLLALAEAGQLELDRRLVDVGDLLRDAQVNFTPQASDRGVTLALDLPAGLPPASGDRRRIAQVLGNLLTNALRHTPEGGCVTLSAAPADGWLRVSVADTGAGIPPEDLPYIFERFWRGEKSRSRAGGGSGLGLAIARRLVELHGGTLGVESTPGRGATFRFTLPLSTGRA